MILDLKTITNIKHEFCFPDKKQVNFVSKYIQI